MGNKDKETIFSGNASFHHVSQIFLRQFSDAKILRLCLFKSFTNENKNLSMPNLLPFGVEDSANLPFSEVWSQSTTNSESAIVFTSGTNQTHPL